MSVNGCDLLFANNGDGGGSGVRSAGFPFAVGLTQSVASPNNNTSMR